MAGRSQFARMLGARNPDMAGRRWLYVPYDQLSDRIGPLSREDPSEIGILLVESVRKAALRPYHRQKLWLVLASQRHFALEQAERGVAVRYVGTRGTIREAVAEVARETGPLQLMEPAERELRVQLAPQVAAGNLDVVPNEAWLTTRDQFVRSQRSGTAPWRMDAFYRLVRRETGLLMEGQHPLGGRFSFDAENRRPWRGTPPAPPTPTFPVDDVGAEVAELIETRFAHHPGRVDPSAVPVTRKLVGEMWNWAKENCLPYFGPFEDAMSRHSAGLFHTRISPLLNLLRLVPVEVVAEVAALDIPLASKEGFIRQVLGWREFVRHAHELTNGFRSLPEGEKPAVAEAPGDGGFGRWRSSSWHQHAGEPQGVEDGGVEPGLTEAGAPLPVAFWGAPSGLACLDRAVSEVWETGWTHHIQRLMVLCNLATLLDVSARELTDWFWIAFIDAFDWVVEPNVLGMGTFALGDLITTKPYISGAAYIARMSDDCATCRFSPSRDCPITGLYWAFLERHRAKLEQYPRMRLPLASLARRDPGRRRQDAATFVRVRDTLARGDELWPAASGDGFHETGRPGAEASDRTRQDPARPETHP